MTGRYADGYYVVTNIINGEEKDVYIKLSDTDKIKKYIKDSDKKYNDPSIYREAFADVIKLLRNKNEQQYIEQEDYVNKFNEIMSKHNLNINDIINVDPEFFKSMLRFCQNNNAYLLYEELFKNVDFKIADYKLLDNNVNVNFLNEIILSKNFDVIKSAVEDGDANIHKLGYEHLRVPPFYLAIKTENKKIIDFFINKGVYLNPDMSGKQMIFTLIENDDNMNLINIKRNKDIQESIKIYLLKKIGNVNLYSNGDSLLSRAIRRDNKKVIDYMLANGATIIDNNIEDSLTYAIYFQNLDLVKKLDEANPADITEMNNTQYRRNELNLLGLAAMGKNVDLVKYLIDAGYDINSTPCRAVANPICFVTNSFEMFKYFHENGGVVNDEKTFLNNLITSGNAEIFDMYNNINPLVNKETKEKMDLFKQAIYSGNIDIVIKMVEIGFDMNQIDNENKGYVEYIGEILQRSFNSSSDYKNNQEFQNGLKMLDYVLATINKDGIFNKELKNSYGASIDAHFLNMISGRSSGDHIKEIIDILKKHNINIDKKYFAMINDTMFGSNYGDLDLLVDKVNIFKKEYPEYDMNFFKSTPQIDTFLKRNKYSMDLTVVNNFINMKFDFNKYILNYNMDYYFGTSDNWNANQLYYTKNSTRPYMGLFENSNTDTFHIALKKMLDYGILVDNQSIKEIVQYLSTNKSFKKNNLDQVVTALFKLNVDISTIVDSDTLDKFEKRYGDPKKLFVKNHLENVTYMKENKDRLDFLTTNTPDKLMLEINKEYKILSDNEKINSTGILRFFGNEEDDKIYSTYFAILKNMDIFKQYVNELKGKKEVEIDI